MSCEGIIIFTTFHMFCIMYKQCLSIWAWQCIITALNFQFENMFKLKFSSTSLDYKPTSPRSHLQPHLLNFFFLLFQNTFILMPFQFIHKHLTMCLYFVNPILSSFSILLKKRGFYKNVYVWWMGFAHHDTYRTCTQCSTFLLFILIFFLNFAVVVLHTWWWWWWCLYVWLCILKLTPCTHTCFGVWTVCIFRTTL